MRLDLHLHTTCSDGALAPEAVVRAAARAGLDVIAITDHDTTRGVAPARAEADRTGGAPWVLAGLELSCTKDGTDFHLLGYGVAPEDAGPAALTAVITARRRERVAEMVNRLVRLGVAIRLEDVVAPAGNAAVGRPHLAEALVRLGAVPNVQAAFDRWLRDGGPAHVPHRGPSPEQGIEAVHRAGGLAVWAHPATEDARDFIALREAGLDGVEALRPNLPPAESAALEHAARSAGLLVTGGSDWHGTARPALGSWYVTHQHVAGFVERSRIAPA